MTHKEFVPAARRAFKGDGSASARALNKALWRITALCVGLILTCGGLALGLIAVNQSNQTRAAVQGSCQFFKDLSELPTDADSKQVLLLIIADSRVAYVTGKCESAKGKLQPPDARVRPLLPRDMR